MAGPYLACGAFLLVWVGAAAAMVWFLRREKQRRLHRFAASTAQQLGGSVSDVPLRLVPEIRFPFEGEQALIRLNRDRQAGGTVVEYELPTTQARILTLRPCGVLGRLIRFFRINVVETGDPGFDREWTVESNDAGFVQRFPDAEARAQARAIAAWVAPEPVTVSLAARRLKVETSRSFLQQPTLVPFVEACNQFARLVLVALGHAPASAQAIRFVEAPDASPAIGACQVCGDPVETDRVLCKRCRTPHHRECWEYLGGCSTFGCATRESVAG